MIKTITVTGVAGLNYIQVPQLSSVTPLRVTREGIGYNYVTTSPLSREYGYVSNLGKVFFETVFSGPERVYVRYKYTL